MTRAPANLLAVRSLLLEHLNPDRAARDVDLEPNEVGIVGDANHRGGYHCGEDRVVTNDYSVVESPRDRAGLTDDAAALDVGNFRLVVSGRTHNLFTFSTWCVAQCVANAPDTRDIREIIYSPDGKTVLRWDRLGRRSSGDRSHLWHTHFSWFRDAIKAGRDQRPLFRRYLQSIGLLGDDVSDYVEYNDRGPGVYRLQYRLNRLGFDVGQADGWYWTKTRAGVRAFELSVNPKYDEDGGRVTAATWTRLDDAYFLPRKDAPKLPAQPAPPIDYAKLGGAVDLAQLAARVDPARLVADLDYRRFAIEILQALPNVTTPAS